MAGTATNTSLWSGADVYTAVSGTAGPTDTTTAWAVAWTALGLLDGEGGFAETREDDSSDFYAWGGLLVKTSRSKHKRQIKFTVLEDNAATFALLNPGSTRNIVTTTATSTIKVPTYPIIAIGFETVAADGIKKRRFAKTAQIAEVGEIVESESGITTREVTVTIFPEADGTLYKDVQTAPV
jgi:hypothetical protein